MPRSYKEVEILVVKLEHSLREARLWSSNCLSEEALRSKLPFALDAISFEQWLQFVFIPKMTEIVNTRNPLPSNLELLPMAEQSLSVANNLSEVIEVIRQIDQVFTKP